MGLGAGLELSWAGAGLELQATGPKLNWSLACWAGTALCLGWHIFCKKDEQIMRKSEKNTKTMKTNSKKHVQNVWENEQGEKM